MDGERLAQLYVPPTQVVVSGAQSRSSCQSPFPRLPVPGRAFTALSIT